METTLHAKFGVRHACAVSLFFAPTNLDPSQAFKNFYGDACGSVARRKGARAEKDNCAFLLFGFCIYQFLETIQY
jgi:hypothetical protein